MATHYRAVRIRQQKRTSERQPLFIPLLRRSAWNMKDAKRLINNWYIEQEAKEKIVSTVEKNGILIQYSRIEGDYLVEYQKQDKAWIEINRLPIDGKNKPA